MTQTPPPSTEPIPTGQLLGAAIELLAACQHLPPSERHTVAHAALHEHDPTLLIVTVAHLALAYLEQCAHLLHSTPQQLLATTALQHANRQLPPSPSNYDPN